MGHYLMLYQRIFLFLSAGLSLLSTGLFAFPALQKIADTTVDPLALTIEGNFGQAINGVSFQQDAVISHNGYQYVAYYNGNRHVCVARRYLPSGPWQTIELTDYYFASNDAHNTISMGICPNDGTIHLAFDHHGHPLHYRLSQVGVATDPGQTEWQSSLFGPVRNYLETGKTFSLTYPAFIQTPAGDLQMIYRTGGSGNGDWWIADYHGSDHSWHNSRGFISRSGTFTDEYNTSTSRCAYPNNYTYGLDGVFHVTWCWREGTQGANHDIMYGMSTDNGYTWLNDKNTALRIAIDDTIPQTLLSFNGLSSDFRIIGRATGNAATQQLIHIDSPGVIVVNLSRRLGMINQQAQAVDPQGRVHVVTWHSTEETIARAADQGYPDAYSWHHPMARRYHHYWRDNDGSWRHFEMNWVAGNRPKLFIRPNGDAFFIYGASRDPSAMWGGGVQFSDGDLKIAAATAASGWTDWQIIHTEPGLFVNEFLADPIRFQSEQILSIMAQDSPVESQQSTPLRIIEFQLQ